MTEWHVFTKDGEELTGASLAYEQGCMVLFRRSKTKVMQDKRDWRYLWLKWRTDVYYEYDRVYDYIIPIPEVKKVERWDTSTEKPKE